MGQYYKAVLLADDKKTIDSVASPHKFGNGAKLMEHSYLRNHFVNTVINKIKDEMYVRLVWAGDYADKEKGSESNLYDISENVVELVDGDCEYHSSIRYIVNEEKKQFIDLWYLPTFGGMTIHPLPLLTAEGNGKGGGDYDGTSMNMVGSWARDLIWVKEYNTYSDKMDESYKEITPDFAEWRDIEETILKGLKLLSHGHGYDIDNITDLKNRIKEETDFKLMKDRYIKD